MSEDFGLPEYGHNAPTTEDWMRAQVNMRHDLDALRGMENPPQFVVWFNTEHWWKRLLRRLHLIRRPKPFDWVRREARRRGLPPDPLRVQRALRDLALRPDAARLVVGRDPLRVLRSGPIVTRVFRSLAAALSHLATGWLRFSMNEPRRWR